MDRPLDAAVIGAGGAGLGVSFVLAKAGLSHRVLERGRIGETWLTQRWDSFYLNTPKVQAVMPGDRYEGADPEGFYTRDGKPTSTASSRRLANSRREPWSSRAVA